MFFPWLLGEGVKTSSKKNREKMLVSEMYQKVAYIGLRNPDGSYLTNVPLYVKVSELNQNGLTDMQEELIHKITSIMLQQYQQQFGEFIDKKRKEKAKELSEKSKVGKGGKK